jgi:hypothetical protein
VRCLDVTRRSLLFALLALAGCRKSERYVSQAEAEESHRRLAQAIEEYGRVLRELGIS